MVSWPRKLRSIVRSELFEQSASQVAGVKRLDEILVGVEWALANDPERYPEIPGTTLRVLLTDPFPDIPQLRVYFTIEDADYVTLQWIEPIEDGMEEEEDFT